MTAPLPLLTALPQHYPPHRSISPLAAGVLAAAGDRRQTSYKEIRAMSSRDDLKAELIQTDEQFRRLYEEHREYERRLAELTHKSLPSQDDEIEEKKIKLHKLTLKDRMEEILRAHREAHVSA